MSARPRFAWRYVVPFALAELAAQLAFADRYGYHRDELYFRVAARHPAVAYDDQGALTPQIGRLSEWLFGETPRGLRVLSAVMAAPQRMRSAAFERPHPDDRSWPAGSLGGFDVINGLGLPRDQAAQAKN